MQDGSRLMESLCIADAPVERFATARDAPPCHMAGLPTTGFAMGHSTLDRGGAIPEHRHPNEEVYVILSGTGLITVSNEQREVAEDCVTILAPLIFSKIPVTAY